MKILGLYFKGPVATLVAEHYLECCCNMVVFQNGLVIVADSDGVLHLDKEHIVDAWMFKVMNTGCSKQGEVFVFINFSFHSQLSVNKEVIYCLAQIRPVSFVVVCDIFIASLNLGCEFD